MIITPAKPDFGSIKAAMTADETPEINAVLGDFDSIFNMHGTNDAKNPRLSFPVGITEHMRSNSTDMQHPIAPMVSSFVFSISTA